METKRIVIILGGSFGLYSHKGVFRDIERILKCSIMRTSLYKLKTKVKNIIIEFYICNSPIKDKNYYFQRKYFGTVWKEIMPPPANEIVTKIRKPNIVLFFGYCGNLKDSKSIYIPTIFREIFFDKNKLMEVNEQKIEVKNKIKIKNVLRGKIRGDKAVVITSNLTLGPIHEKPESKQKVIRIANILSKSGDIVDKESYQIVKYFNNKVPLGVYLQSSDVLINKRHMLSPKGMEVNKNKFNRNIIRAIKIFLDRLGD